MVRFVDLLARVGTSIKGIEMENKTSVLMSVYAKENASFFNTAIESILVNQSRKPDEFVLVCDGPLTLELDQVITKYKDAFPNSFIVYRLKKNVGLGKALKYGLKKCRYNIIIRADSDDICALNRIKTQFDYLVAHPDISIVGSHIDEFIDNWKMPTNIKKMPLSNEELIKMAKFRNPINHMTVAFRRDDILKIGSYRHIPYIEDYELWVRAIINGCKLANIDEVLVHARIGNGMVKRRGNKQYIKSWKKLCEYMYAKRMINKRELIRNMFAVCAFVYTPTYIKKLLYKNVLRKKGQ